jgi:ABC-type uncharacterized transport system fused permease/ATPase subunit
LKLVDLDHLVERVEYKWDTVLNWEDILSLGEQQRIAMARLFYHQPRVAILDECTSALNVELEKQFYEKCQELNIRYIRLAILIMNVYIIIALGIVLALQIIMTDF